MGVVGAGYPPFLSHIPFIIFHNRDLTSCIIPEFSILALYLLPEIFLFSLEGDVERCLFGVNQHDEMISPEFSMKDFLNLFLPINFERKLLLEIIFSKVASSDS